jgi:hypothetical protein
MLDPADVRRRADHDLPTGGRGPAPPQAHTLVHAPLALTTGLVLATVRGVMEQTDQISASIDAAALDNTAGPLLPLRPHWRPAGPRSSRRP